MWTYYFVKWLFASLATRLAGYRIGEIFSQNKDEIVFGFYRDGAEDFYWVLNLEPVFPHMRFFNAYSRAKRNSVDLFTEILDSTILQMKMHHLERSFHFELNNGQKLIFKLHGGRSNVILQNGKTQLFRSQLKDDLNFRIPPESLDGIDMNQVYISDPQKSYPFIDNRSLKFLPLEQWPQLPDEKKGEFLSALIRELERPQAFLFREKDKWHLHKLKPETESELFSDPFEACNRYTSLAGKTQYLDSEKRLILKSIKDELSKAEKAIDKMQHRKRLLTESNEWEETANLIMANLHVFTAGKTEAEIFDFYRQENRIITIKKGVSPQKYAETLYKKSKNKQIEIGNLSQSIERKLAFVARLDAQKRELQDIEDSKTLKIWIKKEGFEQKKNQKETELPFKMIQIDGYDIFIGRNAKNNDLLTTRFARKDDIWLHAKDVSGSHVLIRPKAKEKIPTHVLEKAASAAAWYSKGKNDTLFPVIYTERKYVRKGKGLAAGQVLVDKYDVVIVRPELPET